VQNDILKEYQAQHAWIYPPEPALKLIVDMFEWCVEARAEVQPDLDQRLPHPRGGRDGGTGAGLHAAQRLRVRRARHRAGLDVDDFAPRLSFFFDVHNDFFEEIAKFRAARRIWAKRLRDVYGAKNPESWRLRTHAQTAGVSLVAPQPENNIVRVAYQAMAAVLGGTQSLHTNSMDETLALPTEKSVRIALRTQQVLAYETGVANTIDPLAGSYFVEATDGPARARGRGDLRGDRAARRRGAGHRGRLLPARDRAQRRAAAARDRVGRARRRRRERVHRGQRRLGHRDPAHRRRAGEAQRERWPSCARARRRGVAQALAGCARPAPNGENVIEPMLECVRAYCTLFEIRHALEEVYGAYREPIFF
jgi:methylmalonyl-CoA mutase, N-terminal domain